MSDVVAKCDNEKITKVKVASAEIIVSGKADKPYYEIKYYDLSKNEWCIGYGSYELKFVFQWINECFKLAKNPQECEWFKYDYRTIAPKNHDVENPYWRIPEDMNKLEFCPYCGRKIKVIE